MFRLYLNFFFGLILIFFFLVGLMFYIVHMDKFSKNSIINFPNCNPTVRISSSNEHPEKNVKFNIFFIESNLTRKEIAIKQMCCIESAAKHNPLASIQVYTLQAKLNPNVTYLLSNYMNVQIVQFDAERDLSNKNVKSFWKNGTIHKSPFSYSHLSDFLRSVCYTDEFWKLLKQLFFVI